MKTSFFTAAALLALTFSASAVEVSAFPFKDGDKPVVFIGDSITEQKQYTTFLETFLLTRFPEWKLTFRNAGWSGDTMNLRTRNGLDNGFKRDIQPLKPMIATIDFGMNDARMGASNIATYADAAIKLTDFLTNEGCRVILVTPSPEERYEPGQPGGSAYNLMLRRYAAALADVSARTGIPLIDQLEPFIACIESGRKAGVLGPFAEPRLIPDGVHPNLAGHLVMAASILKGMKAPALVSRLELDGAKGSVTTADNCTASVEKDGDALTVIRTDKALPWAIPEEARFVLSVPGFTALTDLDRFELAVKNLPAGAYMVTCDKVILGTWNADQLAAGLNLATSACPPVAQALALHVQVVAKNNLYFDRWRNVQLLTKVPNWLASSLAPGQLEKARETELARLDAAILAAEAKIDALRKPQPWTLTIQAVPALQ